MLRGIFYGLVSLAAMLIVLHFVLHLGQRAGGPVGGFASFVESHISG